MTALKFSEEKQLDVWYDEITKLCPEIAQRDKLRKMLVMVMVCNDPDLYFATIPLNVQHIIIPMVEDLRISWRGENSALPAILAKARESLDKFVEKYRDNRYRQPSQGYDLIILNGKALNSDFPQTVGSDCGGWIGVKFIAGQPRFALHREWVIRMYMGNQFDHMQMADNCTDEPNIAPQYFERADEKYNLFLEFTISRWFRAGPIHILPCGLIMMHVEESTGPAAFLLNPKTLQRSDKFKYKRSHYMVNSVMDDMGNVIRLCDTGMNVLSWSDLSPELLRFKVI